MSLKCEFAKKPAKKSNSHCQIASTDLDSNQENLILMLKEKSDVLLGLTGSSHFLKGLAELTELLFEIEPADSELMKVIDKKAQDLGTYYFAAYSESRNVHLSLRVFRTVRFLVRYIVLMDRYYEVGNLEYKRQAAGLLKTVKTECEGYMKYATQFSLAQCWPFWEFEELMKERLLKGMTFDKKEIMHHLMFKSSDAPTIYARVIDSELATFNPNVALVLHYNQALQDIQDDFEDIEEDLSEETPSGFILAATENISFRELADKQQRSLDEIHKALVKSGAIEKMLSIVLDYKEAAQNISLPPAYTFLKSLNQVYAETLIGELTKLLEQKNIVVDDDNDDGKKCYFEIPAICSV